jgi:DNA transposition AAA+ family ATPase
MWENRTDILDAEAVDQKLRKLEHARKQSIHFGYELLVAGFPRCLRVMIADHRHAGRGWNADGLSIAKRIDEMPDDRDGLAQIAGVPVHLTATGLSGIEFDNMAEPLQHAYYGLPRGRKERVVITGDEECDSQCRAFSI